MHWVLRSSTPDAAAGTASRGPSPPHSGGGNCARADFDGGPQRLLALASRAEEGATPNGCVTTLAALDDASEALIGHGPPSHRPEEGARVAIPEVQVFEDAVCLTFIETQFLDTADKLGDEQKMVDVVAKTLKKMSPAGHAAAATIPLDGRAAEIVRRATEQLSA